MIRAFRTIRRRPAVNDLKYPVGKFEPRPNITDMQRGQLIQNIAEAPGKLRRAILGMSPGQLDTPYRPEGWTVQQTVNHVADSHLNGYLRFKLALTEGEPAIKTYEEKLWAELEDGRTTDPGISLALLDALHHRWVTLLSSLGAKDFARTTRHPEWGLVTLDHLLELYEWHGRHHTAHITALGRRMGW
jgi:uncharacterized damage-inducible protein DinB